MLKIELVPDMEHCVETLAKRQHGKLEQQILLADGRRNRILEKKLEILGLLLNTADFPSFRAESEQALVEGCQVRYTLYYDDGLKYEMNVK
ncbi:hypothetical protein ACFLW1_02405 [Chloroflexota bacterium]